MKNVNKSIEIDKFMDLKINEEKAVKVCFNSTKAVQNSLCFDEFILTEFSQGSKIQIHP